MSKPKLFRCEWIWNKVNGANFANANKQPLKIHEDVCVFYYKTPAYNPQGLESCSIVKSNSGKGGRLGHVASESKRKEYVQTSKGYPKSIQFFSSNKGIHPTQKPVALFEYLIRTYTNEGDLVLDNCAGSGTTAVACENLKRRWVCVEKETEYFDKAVARLHAM